VTGSEYPGDDVVIDFVGRDDDGHKLAVITADEAFAGTLTLELLKRGDDSPWWELACGPGGWVAPAGQERFRVLRIETPDGKVLHDYEADESY
jgi:hypothetical protein